MVLVGLMENDDKSPVSAKAAAKKTEDAAETQLPDAALEDVSGGLKPSERFPYGGIIRPIKERPEDILTPRDDV